MPIPVRASKDDAPSLPRYDQSLSKQGMHGVDNREKRNKLLEISAALQICERDSLKKGHLFLGFVPR